MKNKRKAFTLIELLIVIAIIGILFIVLVSRIDFATDKAKTTGVQTDFRAFQVAMEQVARENAGFNTFGFDTGDNGGGIAAGGSITINGKAYTYTNADKDKGDGIRNSYDEGDTNLDGKNVGETWTGRKVYTETWSDVWTLVKPGTSGYDADTIFALESAINKNLDPKLHITINADGKITMANQARDPWKNEYHGYYITNAETDKGDRGAIVIYSNGANGKWGSAHSIAHGVVSVWVPGNNVDGKDDMSIAVAYSYINGFGSIDTNSFGFNGYETEPQNGSTGNNNPGNGNGGSPEEPNNTVNYELTNGFYVYRYNSYNAYRTDGQTSDGALSTRPNQDPLYVEGDADFSVVDNYWDAAHDGLNPFIDLHMLELNNDKAYEHYAIYLPQYNSLVIYNTTEVNNYNTQDLINGCTYAVGTHSFGDELDIVTHDMFIHETLTLTGNTAVFKNEFSCSGGEDCNNDWNYTVQSITLDKIPSSTNIVYAKDCNEWVVGTSMLARPHDIGIVSGFRLSQVTYFDNIYTKSGNTVPVEFRYNQIGKTRDDFIYSDWIEYGLTQVWMNEDVFSYSFPFVWDYGQAVGMLYEYPWPYGTKTTIIFVVPASVIPESDRVPMTTLHEITNTSNVFTDSSDVILHTDISMFDDVYLSQVFINGVELKPEMTRPYETYYDENDMLSIKINPDWAFLYNGETSIKIVFNDDSMAIGTFIFNLEDRIVNNGNTFTDKNIYFTIKAAYGRACNVIIDGVNYTDFAYEISGDFDLVITLGPTVVSRLNNGLHYIEFQFSGEPAILADGTFTLDVFSCPTGVSHEYLEPGLYTLDGTLIATWAEIMSFSFTSSVGYTGIIDFSTPTAQPTALSAASLDSTPAVFKEYLSARGISGDLILSLGRINKIGSNAFYAMNDTIASIASIKYVIIPTSVKTIGSYAFANSSIQVIYEGTMEEWNTTVLEIGWPSYPVVHCSDGDSTNISGNLSPQNVYVDAVIPCQNGGAHLIYKPGLYTSDGQLLATWNELVTSYGLNISKNFTMFGTNSSGTLKKTITNVLNAKGLNSSSNVILSIDSSITSIGNYHDTSANVTMIIPTSVTSIGTNVLAKATVIYTGTTSQWDAIGNSTIGGGLCHCTNGCD